MDLTAVELVGLLDLSDSLFCVVDADGRQIFESSSLASSTNPLAKPGPLKLRGRRYVVEHRAWPGRPGTVLRLARPSMDVQHQSHQLQERSQMLNALVAAAPVAILVLDLDMRITMWNPACERIFGWTRDEVMGKPYPLVPEDEWERFEGFFATVIGGQGFAGVEAERSRKDGTRIHIAISTAPLESVEGEVIGAMALLEDITERKMLQARHAQATRLEAIGQLAGGVAHDFNNALTVILAYSDVLLANTQEERITKSAGAIKRAAERATELTGQLLAFGRRQMMQSEVIDLNVAVAESVDMLRRLIGADIQVQTALHSQPLWVRADPAQLERLLMNLAANARDAMPDGGELTLTTHAMRDNSTDSWAALKVSDTGEGMDADTVEHIFEPFFTTKAEGKGTGLGLSSVYGIVRQSGGHVDVVSKPDQGTTFCISLPATQPGASTVEDPIVLATSPGAATILLAEDDPEVRLVIRSMLESRGYRVLEAEDGRQALELASAFKGDLHLLVTDVVMPGMSGAQLASQLAEQRPETPVLYVSGYTDDEGVRRGADRGADFIQKPFTAIRLLDLVGQILDR